MSSLLGITMGCPVGIGPEIIIRFYQQAAEFQAYRPVVIGDLGVLKRCAASLNRWLSVSLLLRIAKLCETRG